MIVYLTNTWGNTETTPNHEGEVDYKGIAQLERVISNQIEADASNFRSVIINVQKMEVLTEIEPFLYTSQMKNIVGSLHNKGSDKQATELARNIIEKAAFLSLDNSKLKSSEVMEVKENQLQTLIMPRYKYRITDTENDCDPDKRNKYSNRLLELYQSIVIQIDDTYDPNADENQPVTNGFVPPESYKEPYDSGQDMSDVKDKATREAYKKYIEEQHQKVNRRESQQLATFVRERYSKEVVQYLIDAYSLFPHKTAELERMVTEKKVDPEMSRSILDAVRKIEKENPDKGFRIWLSNDKMFKTEAKLISINKDSVTIENKNGKQSTIELSALRKEDQDYAKKQLESEKKTVDEEKVKKD
jgi:hypothetical protein